MRNFPIILSETIGTTMYKLLEIARAFYGVLIPRKYQKNFLRIAEKYLDERYSVETAVGLALRKINLNK
jgi:hypothetical protein